MSAPTNQYAVVDLSDDSTTVYPGPCLLVGIHTQATTSGQVCPIKDGTTTVFALSASSPLGDWFEGFDTRFETSLIVDPDNSATGTITVIYQPFHDGQVG